MKRIVFALAILLVATASRADQIYAVSGSLTITGNDACSGPCTETIDFSFDVNESVSDAVSTDGRYVLSVMPASIEVASSGPLGNNFTTGGNIQNPLELTGAAFNFMEFTNSSAEIDLWFAEDSVNEPFVPELAGTYLYSCSTNGCMTDFCGIDSDAGCSAQSFPFYNVATFGVVDATVTPIVTPEPRTIWLLAAGLVLLFFFYPRNDIRDLIFRLRI